MPDSAIIGEDITPPTDNLPAGTIIQGQLKYRVLKNGNTLSVIGYNSLPSDGGLTISQKVLGFAVTTIETGAFQDADLTSVSMSFINVIEENAFKNCTALSSVIMRDIVIIQKHAFAECNILSSVAIPTKNCCFQDALSVNPSFLGCVWQPEEQNPIVVSSCPTQSVEPEPDLDPNGILTYVAIDATTAMVTGYDRDKAPTSNWDLVIPDKTPEGLIITTIGTTAFSECKALISVNTSNVTEIESSAFLSCEFITDLVMLNVQSIGEDAFNSCYALVNIDMPNVSFIADYAFFDCDNLKSVNMPKNSCCFNPALLEGSFAECKWQPSKNGIESSCN